MTQVGKDTLGTRSTLTVNGKDYVYYSLEAAAQNGLGDISRLPASLKVLLENMLRNEDGSTVTKADIQAFKTWLDNGGDVTHEIAYRPARVSKTAIPTNVAPAIRLNHRPCRPSHGPTRPAIAASINS